MVDVAVVVVVVDVAVVEICEDFLEIFGVVAVQESEFPSLEGSTRFAKFLERSKKRNWVNLFSFQLKRRSA